METPKQSLSNLATIVSNLSKTTHSFMEETRSFIQNLELQIGQLSKRIPEIPSSTLPSNTEVNPKEEYKALNVEVKAEPKEEPMTEELKEIKTHEETENVTMHTPMQIEEPEEHPFPDVLEESKEEQIAQFLAILRKLKANSSCAEVLEKNPPSMACPKSMIPKKKTLKRDETVVLTKECSSLVQKKLPQKLPDPRSFLIPCTIGTITLRRHYATLA
ncbi:uncharacterized protein LOC130939922 [Arachis stenosperma]|uniref:uncharacterized protein LOC130939922 n=1 Tax=Arachis stenosperma TaxID=217475 RepID=UPI0025AC2B08|nr:uncharacterized protein LOC130939922 [Arachis stenosperma]